MNVKDGIRGYSKRRNSCHEMKKSEKRYELVCFGTIRRGRINTGIDSERAEGASSTLNLKITGEAAAVQVQGTVRYSCTGRTEQERPIRLRLSMKVYCTVLHPLGRFLRPLQHPPLHRLSVTLESSAAFITSTLLLLRRVFNRLAEARARVCVCLCVCGCC